MLTKWLITILAHDLLEVLKHITWSRRRPLVRSDVELCPWTTHGSLGPKGRVAGGSSKAGVGPQLPQATNGQQIRLGTAAGGASRGTAAWSRPCVVAGGVVMQSGYPVRPMDVPN